MRFRAFELAGNHEQIWGRHGRDYSVQAQARTEAQFALCEWTSSLGDMAEKTIR